MENEEEKFHIVKGHTQSSDLFTISSHFLVSLYVSLYSKKNVMFVLVLKSTALVCVCMFRIENAFCYANWPKAKEKRLIEWRKWRLSKIGAAGREKTWKSNLANPLCLISGPMKLIPLFTFYFLLAAQQTEIERTNWRIPSCSRESQCATRNSEIEKRAVHTIQKSSRCGDGGRC